MVFDYKIYFKFFAQGIKDHGKYNKSHDYETERLKDSNEVTFLR